MNEARDLYLRTHSIIDKINHLIKNCNMAYRSWKYWHSAMTHGKALVVVVAYGMCLECCTGSLCSDWKVKPVTFYRFREILGRQMLTYSPTHREYPGDEQMHACTQQVHKKRRAHSSSVTTTESMEITRSGITQAKLNDKSERLSGFLDDLLVHECSIQPLKNKTHQICHCRGKPVYHICTACPGSPALHLRATNDRHNSCFLHFHNAASFGMWREDAVVTGKRRKEWKYPTDVDLQESSHDMRRLHLSLLKHQRSDASVSSSTTAGAMIRLGIIIVFSGELIRSQ